MELLLKSVKDANEKIIENLRMREQLMVNQYADLEKMYIEELLKSNHFNLQRLIKRINENVNGELFMEMTDGLIEIEHVVATFHHNIQKDLILVEIFQTLENHAKAKKDINALLYVFALRDTPPSELLAKKLNNLYQNPSVSFESRTMRHNYDDDDNDNTFKQLVLCRKIKY
jgi:hypothetical protein